MKHDGELLRRIANNQYNIELVLRHNQRMEKALKIIIKMINSGYPDDYKLKRIEEEIEKIRDYIWMTNKNFKQ